MSQPLKANPVYQVDVRPGNRYWRKIKRQKTMLFMLLPGLFLIMLFNYLPLVGWLMAFKRYEVGLNMWDASWTGIEQFHRFFVESDDFGYLLTNTLFMNFGSIIVNIGAAFVFALMLNEIKNRRLSRLIQTVSFFPFFISWVIVYALIHSLFAASTGALNETLVAWGWLDEGLNILGDPAYSWWLIILVKTWKYIGYNGVIFIAAIASINSDEFEAAEIDGANRWGKVLHITVPNLMPTLIVLLIMNVGWVFSSEFDLYYLFTNPTNRTTMEVLDMYIYNFGLKLGNFSYATAVGIIKTVISILLLILTNAISKRVTGKSIL